jgi:hypothetical protein
MNLSAHHFLRAAALAALMFTAISCRTHNAGEGAGAWKPIFDGRSTEGWQMVGPGELRLENGVLVTRGGMGMLWYTREKFGDCRIRVVFKPTTSKDNSGVFIRIPEPPNDPWFAVNRGYEVQIENRGGAWHRTGTLYSFNQGKQNVSARLNEWNEMIITLEGRRTRVEVNGVLVTDFQEGDAVPPKVKDYEPDRGPRPNTGYIGLQNHDDEARVHFREVSIAPLR